MSRKAIGSSILMTLIFASAVRVGVAETIDFTNTEQSFILWPTISTGNAVVGPGSELVPDQSSNTVNVNYGTLLNASPNLFFGGIIDHGLNISSNELISIRDNQVYVYSTFVPGINEVIAPNVIGAYINYSVVNANTDFGAVNNQVSIINSENGGITNPSVTLNNVYGAWIVGPSLPNAIAALNNHVLVNHTDALIQGDVFAAYAVVDEGSNVGVMLKNNVVQLFSGTINGNVVGAYTDGGYDLEGNRVDIDFSGLSGGQVDGFIAAARNDGEGHLQYNIVDITYGEFGDKSDIYGAYAFSHGSAIGNEVHILDGVYGGKIYGAYSDRIGHVKDNKVYISNGIFHNEINAAWVDGPGDVIGNEVYIYDGLFNSPYISGAYNSNDYSEVYEFSVFKNNKVLISGGHFTDDVESIFGSYGREWFNTAIYSVGNEVVITAGSFDLYDGIYASYAQTIIDDVYAYSNKLIIEGGDFPNHMMFYGSYASGESGIYSVGNEVVISGGLVNADQIFADYSVLSDIGATNSFSKNNKVVLLGGDISGDIYGSYIYLKEDANLGALSDGNSIEVYAGALLDHANLYAADSSYPNLVTFSNNAIRFIGFQGGVQEMGGAQIYAFEQLPLGALSDYAVTITGVSPVDLSGTSVFVGSLEDNGSRLDNGQQLKLISQADGFENMTLDANEVSSEYYVYDFERDNRFTDALVLRLIGSEFRNYDYLKSLSEGQLAGMALINQGSDMMGSVIEGLMIDQEKQIDSKWNIFGRVNSGFSRYNTGSHVDLQSSSFITGISKYTNKTLLGAFLEAGWGDFNSYNQFSNWADVNGRGHTRYLGGGLMARHHLNKGFYVDGALRAGQVNTTFQTNDLLASQQLSRYQTDALYYGAQIGLGHKIMLQHDMLLDLSTRYIYSHQAGNQVHLDGYNTPIDLSSITSQRLRTIAQINFKNKGLSPYVGLGHEREFDGIAKTTYGPVSAPNIGLTGDTGIGLIGLHFKKGDSWVMNFNIEGYIGQRQGYHAMINIQKRF